MLLGKSWGVMSLGEATRSARSAGRITTSGLRSGAGRRDDPTVIGTTTTSVMARRVFGQLTNTLNQML